MKYPSPFMQQNAINRALRSRCWQVDTKTAHGDAPATEAELLQLIAEHGTLGAAARASLTETTGTGWIKCGHTRAYYQA